MMILVLTDMEGYISRILSLSVVLDSNAFLEFEFEFLETFTERAQTTFTLALIGNHVCKM